LNRTTLELKRGNSSIGANGQTALNRTTLELKRQKTHPIKIHSPPFESHHFGIETNIRAPDPSKVAKPLNRTTLELKRLIK